MGLGMYVYAGNRQVGTGSLVASSCSLHLGASILTREGAPEHFELSKS